MKRLALLIAFLTLLLTACTQGGQDPAAGRYYLAASYDAKGRNMVQDVTRSSLQLRSNGHFVLYDEQDGFRGRWERQDDTLILYYGEDSFEGNWEEDIINLPFGTFVKGQSAARIYQRAYARIEVSQAGTEAVPTLPAVSGLEGRYYLSYRTLGSGIPEPSAGSSWLDLMPGFELVLHSQNEKEGGWYSWDWEETITLYLNDKRLKGSIRGGSLVLTDDVGDRWYFFDEPAAAAAHRPSRESTASQTEETEPQTTQEETEPQTTQGETETIDIPPISASEPVLADCWYGCAYVGEGSSGIYRLMRGKSYTVYLTLEQAGSFMLYEPSGFLSEKLAGGSWEYWQQNRLTLKNVQIYPLNRSFPDMDLDYLPEWDCFSGRLEITMDGGRIGLEVYLKAWGESWENMPSQIRDKLPDYAAYQEAIRQGREAPYRP